MDITWFQLREISVAVQAITRHLGVGEVLQTILRTARTMLHARYAALGVPDDNGSFREFLADGISDEQWREIGPIPRQHGLLGVMLRDPNPVRLDDIRKHPQFGWWPKAHPELTDFLGMPIVHGEEILGELYMANKEVPGGFTEEDEEMLRLLSSHAAIAIINARLYERNRDLSIAQERGRIARELHDAVTQKLFSLRLTADAAATLVSRDPVRAEEELANVRRLAAEATDELRAVVVGLRPVDLDGDELDVALRKQADLFNRVHDATVRFVGCPVPRLAGRGEVMVYRIAQEALHNALRHADAGTIEIDLRTEGDTLVLTVTDDGAGFGSGLTAALHAGLRLGLASMRERARSIGGRLTLDTEAGEGTTVRLEVPIHG